MVILRITNVADKEIVHQRCLLVIGTFESTSSSVTKSKKDHVAVTIRDTFSKASKPLYWPIPANDFRCLLMLQDGINTVEFKLHSSVSASTTLTLDYRPLSQLPPLHLAIMYAIDSPRSIDCPPAKRGPSSSSQCDLDAAISKLRMTAYIWQAVLAEESRSMNLGRRTFRLDEQWCTDTPTSSHLDWSAGSTAMGSVAKVHLVRIEKTVAELRDYQLAEQNHRGLHPDFLYRCFRDALGSYGLPFTSHARPVVAGLVLDSHYSPIEGLILGHAAIGRHNPSGLSLGMFGSHLTSSWPRSLEEVPVCFLDVDPNGRSVANDHVLRAFGALRTVPAYEGIVTTWGGGKSAPTVEYDLDKDYNILLRAICPFGLALVRFLDDEGQVAEELRLYEHYVGASTGNATRPQTVYQIGPKELEEKYDHRRKWKLEVVGMNGEFRSIANIWSFMTNHLFLKVVGTALVLSKRSVKRDNLEVYRASFCKWSTLLKRRWRDGDTNRLTYARRIDLKVGLHMYGAVVYFSDGTKCNCGQANQTTFGGHQSKAGDLSEAESFKIKKVSVTNCVPGSILLDGCRIMPESGEAWGTLNGGDGAGVVDLEARPDERIIGFYGRSLLGQGFCVEFGIITAPKGVVDSKDGLPMEIYDMPGTAEPQWQGILIILLLNMAQVCMDNKQNQGGFCNRVSPTVV
ncbi:hypothetical protein PG994_006622 [Apiospora phragmitis]|uniref:Jacalin-type lectin domain-containing protein n=1 Tax=Apiospora phragmitis TaxID=2905665 RepID=A0ABR1VFI7_9PEZI